MKFIARLDATKPYRTHLRQMEVIFTAIDIDQAKAILTGMRETLRIDQCTEVIELYRDEQAKL